MNKEIKIVIVCLSAILVSILTYMLILNTGSDVEIFINKSYSNSFDFKIKNTGNETILIRNVQIEVLNSSIDYSPVLRYAPRYFEPHKISLIVKNVGWGPAKNATMRDFYSYANPYFNSSDLSELVSILGIKTDSLLWRGELIEGGEATITHIYEKEFAINERVCNNLTLKDPSYDFYGTIEYRDINGNKQTKVIGLDGLTLKNNTICYGMGWADSNRHPPDYNITLKSESAMPYTLKIPILKQLKPGTTDNFLIDLDSDKTATYNMKIYVNYDEKSKPIKCIKLKIRKINNVKDIDWSTWRTSFGLTPEERVFEMSDCTKG